MIQEIWKDIKGYEGRYQASSSGRIISLKRKGRKQNRINKLSIWKKGYLAVGLSKKGKHRIFMVHRLVAQTFIPNPENKLQVNHRDFSKTNNVVDNLEWVTNKENCLHARKGDRFNPFVKMSKFQVQRMQLLKEISPQLKQYEIAKLFNCSQSNVSRIFNNKIWQHAEKFN